MIIFSIIIFFIVVFAVTYVFLIMPRVIDSADMELQSTDYAHRGLHSASIPENSLSAFKAAKDAGFGIELDLRLSADGKIFVFHDENTYRMCGIKNRISSMTSSQIKQLYLKGSFERIPLLSEVLSLIDGSVPILIEIKTAPNEAALCRRLCGILDTYSGAFAIQSFSPKILSYFKKYRPRFARGQLVTHIKKGTPDSPSNPFLLFALNHMLTNVISRPDFISIHGNYLKEPAFLLTTRLFKRKGFVWTVKSQTQYNICQKNNLYTIFENIYPKI